MTTSPQRTWAALGDPTRIGILNQLLAGGPASASRLTRTQSVSRQAVSKHLETLERAGLVHRRPQGREVLFEIEPAELDRARRQMTAVATEWDQRLQRLKRLAEAATPRATDPDE